MTKILTDEECGKLILKIYDNGDGAGQMLQELALFTPLNQNKGLSPEDFKKGLTWLLKKGYVERKKGKDSSYIF